MKVQHSLSKAIQSFAFVATVITSTLAMSSVAQAAWFSCEPREVLELSNRAHVECRNSFNANGSNIRYIAINKNSSSTLDRFVKLATAALLSNKYFRVSISTSSSSNVSGCVSSNCRTPTSFGVRSRS